MGWLDSIISGAGSLFGGDSGVSGGIGTSDILRDTASSAADYVPTTQSSGFDWNSLGGGFGKLGLDLLGGVAPTLAGAAAGYGFGSLMGPGKTSLVDTRTPEQKGSAGMNFARMSSLQANPTGFGLPGDPLDPNTPAGKKRYDIINTARAADAARGAFTTGGSAQRETNALNTAVGNEYNTIWDQSSKNAAAGSAMKYVEKNNPWAMILGGAVAPAVKNTTAALLKSWGLA